MHIKAHGIKSGVYRNIRSSAKERFHYKNKDLEYQREYRLVFSHEIPEDHFIRIGALSNTKILESRQLEDLCFSIDYKSHRKLEGISEQ